MTGVVFRPLVRGSTYRRGVYLLLGAVILLPYVLLGAAFVQMLGDPAVPVGATLILLAVTVAIAAVPAFLRGTRALEIVAVRGLLDVDLPDPPGAPGAGLGTFAVVGAVLTLGLVQRWGEVFPRWMVGLAGRRVPVRLAVVPASLVAVAVTAASLSLFSSRQMLDLVGTGSVAVLPMVLWPVWGVTLAAATLAYYLRRTA